MGKREAEVDRRPDYRRQYPTARAVTNSEQERLALRGFLTRPELAGASSFARRLAALGAEPTPSHRIVPACHGRIDAILLAVPPNDPEDKPLSEEPVKPILDRHFSTLLKLLGPGRRYTIVCHHYQQERVRRWAADAGIAAGDLNLVLSVFNYSVWAQEPYVVLKADAAAPVLCEGVMFNRREDMAIADDVTAQSDVGLRQSPLFFQGGNILPTPSGVLIGKDYVWRNKGRVGMEDEQKVLARFTQLFGSPAVMVGRDEPLPDDARYSADGLTVLSGLFQPIFHIDMYVTPTGVIGKSGREIVFVGRPSLAREILKQPAGPYDHDAYFAEAETQLAARFEVHQTPLLPERGKLNYDTDDFTQVYFLTWNNALVENYAAPEGTRKRVVYLPTYAQDAERYKVDRAAREKLDAAAAAIWAGIGFEVRAMDGLENFAYSGGSVHCITKDLVRGPYTPDVARG